MDSMTTPGNRAQRRAIQREEKKAAKKAAKRAIKLGLPVNKPTTIRKKEVVGIKNVESMVTKPSESEAPVVIPTEHLTAAVPVTMQNDIIESFSIDDEDQKVDSISVITDRPLTIIINEEEVVDNNQENETSHPFEVTQTSLLHQQESDDDDNNDNEHNDSGKEEEEMISDITSITSSFLYSPDDDLKHTDCLDHALLSIGSHVSDPAKSDILGTFDNRGSEQTLVVATETKKVKSSKTKHLQKVILTLSKRMKKEKISNPEKLLTTSPGPKKNKPWKFWKKKADSRVTIVQ
ncbi:hypothetical protein BC941DRAFT_456302 [Chlamydoabsidia padenii]|nr:hypothetical protein BC941DRAFT_456302 [Chlamydoabsidia padenii]